MSNLDRNSESERTLAAEYVLGLLDPPAHAEAERRLAHDPHFAREVEQWRTRFAPLDETADIVSPDARLWSRIENGIATPPAARDSEPGMLARFWNSLGALRAASVAGALAALLLAVVSIGSLQYARQEAIRKPIYVAVLVSDPSKEPGAVVNAFADGRVEMIPLTEINVPEGRALEIWTLWDRQVGPRSVGLLQRARATQLNLENLPRTGENQLFEITLEPATGSPTGRPTGPVLFKGTTSRTL
ncbi:MAG: anti-sigma factor [Pseudorhodoplanes sp.]|nr:anti-sigma factor [Pseudorhodoplanes sp.]